MHRQAGFNLLECLLVLAVIVTVSLIGIRRYRQTQQNIHIEEIKSDVMAIQEALRHYYRAQGCRVNGIFSANLAPSLPDLGLHFLGRPPEIPLNTAAYQAVLIKETALFTADKKPIYRLQVSATFAPTTTTERMLWYQTAFGATAIDGQRLIWQTLANSTASDRGTTLWVMQASSQQFRHQENAARQQLSLSADVSGAYCAH